ncbi:MAG: acidic tetraheme cytochrome c3 TmcA [Desulfohalobiaceae bacterium]
MRNNICIFVVTCFLLLLWTVVGFSQSDMQKVDSSAFEKNQRPAAVFVHDEHNEQAEIHDCSVCHHVYEDGELVEGAMSVGEDCADCHSLEGDQENPIGLMDAYHQQCINCHEQEKQGPLACGECHVK